MANTQKEEGRRLKRERLSKLSKVLPWMLIIGGIIGIICSLVLIHDQIELWKNPGFHPACNLNPIVNCGTVIDSKQGEILGFPAPFLGMLAFPALVTVGVAILAGAKFKRWFWQLMELAAAGGVVFALWLFWLSLYKIHALCPFCLTVDAVVYILFWYLTLFVIREGHVTLPTKLRKAGEFSERHHLDILLFWFLLLIAYILQHFWYYFGQHLPF